MLKLSNDIVTGGKSFLAQAIIPAVPAELKKLLLNVPVSVTVLLIFVNDPPLSE